MAAVDTNVLIRCIVQDDRPQCDAVEFLRQRCAQESCKLFVPSTVLLEMEWVLRSCLGFSKSEVIAAMSRLLDTEDFDFEKESAMADALNLFKLNNADLADCMHTRIAASEGRGPLHTFDRLAGKLPGAKLLEVERRSVMKVAA